MSIMSLKDKYMRLLNPKCGDLILACALNFKTSNKETITFIDSRVDELAYNWVKILVIFGRIEKEHKVHEEARQRYRMFDVFGNNFIINDVMGKQLPKWVILSRHENNSLL